MDPNNPIPSNHDQFDVKPAYMKQLIDDDRPMDMDRPGFDMNLLLTNTVCGGMARNGKHRVDDDEEYDYTDNLGPETDVDAGEDVHDNNYPLAASSSLDPSPESEKSPVEVEKHSDDDRNDNNYSNRDNANVCPVDSVVDDDNVEVLFPPSDRDVCGADDEARVETAGTHTVVDDGKSEPSPQAAKPQHVLIDADYVAESESEDEEWNYYPVNPNKSAAAAIVADESRKDVEEQSAQENPESVAKGSSEVEPLKTENDIKCEELKDTSSSELINIDISDERKSSGPKKDQILLDLQEEKREQDNMDFQLNPEAAEFVPSLSSPPLVGPRGFLHDLAISGSPLKRPQAMDDIPVPSQSEFEKEVSNRPKEIGEEFSHDGQADLQNNSSQSMDTSEISSTKAEMGDDESMMHVMSTSQWQTNMSSQWNEKTGDDAGSDSEEDDIVTKNNPMAMSLTPGNLKAALEKSVDLNAVHMLDDSSDGAEQVNTPPRSPEPCANEDRAHLPISEDKSSSDVLRASTPQIPDNNSVSSEISCETIDSGTTHNKERDCHWRITTNPPFSKKGMKVIECLGLDIGPPDLCPAITFEKSDRSTRSESSTEEESEEDAKLTEEDKEENKEQLCKIEDDTDTSLIMKPATQSLQNYSQMVEKEGKESEEPKDLPDSTNHSSFNDAIHISKQDDLQQSLLSTKTLSEMALGTEQTRYHTNFDSVIIPEKIDDFIQPFQTENTQLNQSNWTDCSKSENSMPQLEIVDPELCEDGSHLENRKQKEIEKLCDKDIDDSNKGSFIEKKTTSIFNLRTSWEELSRSDLRQRPISSAEEMRQHKNQMMLTETTMFDTLINKPTEQEQAEKKAAEFAPIVDEVFKEKVASEGIPSKEGETEPRETEKASPEDTIPVTSSFDLSIAVIDKSKEEVTGIAEASVGAVVVATAATVAMAGPIKAKAATTTSAKRPTKTTTKATTASTTKTITKSTPTSPSKMISAAMRATATSPAQTVAKKPTTSTTTRPKQLDGSTKTALSSTSGKTTVTKTTLTTKAATTTATRTSASPRLSSGTTRPKTTTTTLSKVNSGTPSEKKSTMSSDAKSVSKPATSKPTSTTPRTTITSTIPKTTLVKTSSTTAKTSPSSVTLKPRPASATAAAKITLTSKQPATGVNSASRPRTAPTSSGTTKPRENIGRTITATTAKSPLIDKQSKETVNKQISRSGASAPKISGRASAPTGTTGVTKTRTPIGKSTGNATSPTKKTLTSKTASRTSSTATKRLPSSETKVLQNGIPKEDVTKAAVISATSKPEDDVPRKDTSPVNVPTDNQLIAD